MYRLLFKFSILILLFQYSEGFIFSQKHPQFQTIGVTAGGGFYGINGGEFYDEFDKNLSFHFASVLNYSLSDAFQMCSGLGFELKGAPDKRFNYNTWLSYLIVPLYGKYLFNETPKFYGLAGVYGGYLLAARKKGEIKLGPDLTPVNEDVLSEFNRIDYGIVAGAGYMIQLSFKLDFFVEFKANIGLANIEKAGDFKSLNKGYSLSIGYLYYIGFR